MTINTHFIKEVWLQIIMAMQVKSFRFQLVKSGLYDIVSTFGVVLIILSFGMDLGKITTELMLIFAVQYGISSLILYLIRHDIIGSKGSYYIAISMLWIAATACFYIALSEVTLTATVIAITAATTAIFTDREINVIKLIPELSNKGGVSSLAIAQGMMPLVTGIIIVLAGVVGDFSTKWLFASTGIICLLMAYMYANNYSPKKAGLISDDNSNQDEDLKKVIVPIQVLWLSIIHGLYNAANFVRMRLLVPISIIQVTIIISEYFNMTLSKDMFTIVGIITGIFAMLGVIGRVMQNKSKGINTHRLMLFGSGSVAILTIVWGIIELFFMDLNSLISVIAGIFIIIIMILQTISSKLWNTGFQGELMKASTRYAPKEEYEGYKIKSTQVFQVHKNFYTAPVFLVCAFLVTDIQAVAGIIQIVCGIAMGLPLIAYSIAKSMQFTLKLTYNFD